MGNLSRREVAICRRRLGMSAETLDWVRSHPGAILVVGEAPGPRTRADCPLFPWPATSAGGRLCALAGMSPDTYLATVDRANLCPSEWTAAEARRGVDRVLAASRGRPVVALGRRVASSLRAASGWFAWSQVSYDDVLADLVTVPHPSGRNRVLHDPGARRAVANTFAEAFRRALAGGVAATWDERAAATKRVE